jgi:hypothetical protein
MMWARRVSLLALGLLIVSDLHGQFRENPPPGREPAPLLIVTEYRGTMGADLAGLRKLAPASGIITDQQAWVDLWKAWRPGEPVPRVNWAAQLVLVGTIRGATNPDNGKRNELFASPMLVHEGNLPLLFSGFDFDTPGFAYNVAIVLRGGIKTIDGKPLPPAPEEPEPPRTGHGVLEELVDRVKKLEQANADLRAAVERLQKQVDELKRK